MRRRATGLQLKDVYCAQDERVSVDSAVLTAAALAVYYVGSCYWHNVVTELRRGVGFRRVEARKLGERR